MLNLCKANFWRTAHYFSKLTNNEDARMYSSLQHNMNLMLWVFSSGQGLNDKYHSSCQFHCTPIARLKTIFSEEEQRKITDFVNGIEPTQKSWRGKFRPLNKISESLPSKGPLNDVNELMEKFSLNTSSALSLCYAILKSFSKPEEPVERKKAQKKVVPRKLQYLMKSVRPAIQDLNLTLIQKFTAVFLSENHVSFAVLECGNPNWQSQILKDWNSCELLDSSLTETMLQLWRIIPCDEHYVVHMQPNRGASFTKQSRLLGAILSLLCAKKDFKDDAAQKILQVNGTAPARHFNLFIGNEIVSSMNMITDVLNSIDTSTPDDHVLSRSLAEVTFAENAVIKYNTFDDDSKESLCQSIVLGKAFIDLLKSH